MKVNVCLPFLLGVVYGIVALLLADGNANDFVQDERKETVVLVASDVIEPSTLLTGEMVTLRWIPVSQAPEGAVWRGRDYVRRPLKTRALPGQVITHSMLGERIPSGTICEFPPRYRIFSMPLVAPSAQLDLSRPNDVVDVFVTYRSGDAEGNETLKTELVLKQAKVAAVELRESHHATAPGSIALNVGAKEFWILRKAQNKGFFTFVSAPHQDEPQEVSVVVATDAVRPNVPITEEMVTVSTVRRSDVPSGAFRSIRDLMKYRILRGPASPGEVITIPNTAPRPGPRGIPAGKRVDQVPFIRPGVPLD